ncbi:MAG TPA: outer membrane protein assembly factor BamD [Terriglobales bacterium]|nr:outer membrane protein assembly factor BamD [Terriglobales bacterium]
MFRRVVSVSGIVVLLALAIACTNKKVQNPLANLGSKQPDKVLFDRAMDAMKHNKFDVARLSLQTLINTYPDSEYVARAKLAVGDSWYAEGGTAALQQAEIEYKDFITFFPNMPEAAEAQMKIANIHFQQMEKPDRDFTHALRAQDEYRQMILQYPDSKLVPVAKERLREVQEVLAEREFGIGRFYYLRQSYPAAIARLQDVAQSYPLYSKADEALYMLGQSYEGEVNAIRLGRLNEAAKGKLIADFTKDAAEAYDKIITRYPVMTRAEDARRRLAALHQPIPTPTPQAIAQNKAEEASRHEPGMMSRVMSNFTRHPEMAEAARVGEPSLVDPKPTSATQVVQEAGRVLAGSSTGGQGSGAVSVEQVKPGTAPPPSQAIPRSDSPNEQPGTAPANDAAPAANNATAGATPAASPGSATANPAPSTDSNNTGIEDITSSTTAGTQGTSGNGAQPAAGASGQAGDGIAPAQPAGNSVNPGDPNSGLTAPAAAPTQMNDAAGGANNSSAQSASTDKSKSSSDQGSSSSKKKKKKHKLVPF